MTEIIAKTEYMKTCLVGAKNYCQKQLDTINFLYKEIEESSASNNEKKINESIYNAKIFIKETFGSTNGLFAE